MSLALNEEALTLLFVGRLLVAVVSNFQSNFIDRKQVIATEKGLTFKLTNLFISTTYEV